MATVNDFIREWCNGSDYVLAHTSGSTGKPKEIRLLKADMIASARATNEFFCIDAASVLALVLSPDYIAGKMMIVRALESGARLLELPVSNKIEVKEPVDLIAIVPSQIESLIENDLQANFIRNVLIGGASPTKQQCEALLSRGYKVYISYGMTETCSHVALADGADADRIFHAMPGISFSTTADGRLVVNGREFSFNSLETNDVVELCSPTSFRWRGRADGVINSGGLKFFPEELEAEYAASLRGWNFYVSSVEDEIWGHAIALVFEGGAADERVLRDLLRSSDIDKRKLPKRYYAISHLPRTSNGKVKRIAPDDFAPE
ncbi:MAG: AMP-binding protein [Muribaculaceae bacterium]|nr:AMP-binding protein [Muribaculaceae bacterium]